MKRYEKITREAIIVSSFVLPSIAILGIFTFFTGCGFMYFY